MKKCLAVGIIVILVCVGLSGCQIRECPSPDSGQVIPIQCITSQPRYYNKTVMIHSKYIYNEPFNRTYVTEPSIYWGDDARGSLKINCSYAKNASILVDGHTYYFIGKFRNSIFYVIEIKPD